MTSDERCKDGGNGVALKIGDAAPMHGQEGGALQSGALPFQFRARAVSSLAILCPGGLLPDPFE